MVARCLKLQTSPMHPEERPEEPPESGDGAIRWPYWAVPLLNLAAFGPVYAGIASLYFRDALINYVPYKWWFLQRVLAGELPLWCDSVRSGMPYLGDPVQGFFYPGQLPFLLTGSLHPVHAYGIFAGLQYLAAHTGFFRLARKLGAAPLAAFTGTALLTYGSLALELTSAIQFLYFFAVAGWLCAAFVDLFTEKTITSALKLALWTAIAVTTGDLQGVYLFSLLVMTVSLAGTRNGRRLPLLAGGTLAGGALLSACVILPGLELSSHSFRREENTDALALAWSWNPARIAEWAAPGLYAPPDNLPPAPSRLETGPAGGGGDFAFPRGNPGLIILLLLPVAAAFASARTRHSGRLKFLLGTAFVFLVLAAGSHTGLYELLRRILPGWDQFRFPERQLLQFTIAAGLAGTLVLDLLIRRTGNEDPLPMPQWAKVLALVPLAAALCGSTGTTAAGWLLGSAGTDAPPDYLEWAVERFRWAVPVLAIGSTAVFVRTPQMVRRIVLVAAAAEIFLIALPGLKTAPLSVFEREPELVRELRKLERSFPVPPRIHVYLPPPATGSRIARAQFDWDSLAHDIGILHGFNLSEGYNSSAPAVRELANRIIPRNPLLKLLGVDLLVVKQGVNPGPGWNCGTRIESLGAWICRQDSSPGPVRAPPRWETPATADALIKATGDPSWNPAEVEYLGGFGQTAAGLAGNAVPEPAGTLPAPAILEIHEWTPERRKLHVERAAPGPVIIRDNFFPGWKVYVNGEPGTVMAANGFQMAAWVPAGTRTVEFRYEPQSIRAGFAVSAVTALLMAGLWGRFRRNPAR